MERFLAEYASHGITNTEACFILHHLALGCAPAEVYGKRMGLSGSAVRSVVRSLERKGLIARSPTLGGPNTIELRGAIAWLGSSLLPDSR